MIGIYKITNPVGHIYIGQSVNIEKRFISYKSNYGKSQPKLHNSFLKHGIDNHKFEILIECNKEDLNKLERHYQQFFNCTNRIGLNCKLTNENDSNGTFSEESRLKMSKSAKNKVWTEEHKQKLYGNRKGENNGRYGKPCSEETRRKIGKTNREKGKDTRLKQRIAALKRPKEFYENLAIKNKGKLPPNCIIILNTQTGIFYNSIAEAKRTIPYGKGSTTLGDKILGKRRNNTDFIKI